MGFPTWFTQSAANPGRIIRLKEIQKPVTQSPMVQAAARRQLSARRSEMPRQGDGSWSRFSLGGGILGHFQRIKIRGGYFLGELSMVQWFPVSFQ
jgi:hypothetical protein